MKMLLLILGIVVISCSNSNNKSVTMAKVDSQGIAADSFHTLLTIGGCYTIEIKENEFAGGILIGITKVEEDISYSFLLNGKTFEAVPTAEAFRKGGVWGRKIPSGDSDDILSFDSFSISEKDLEPILNKFKLIETIAVSKKNSELIGSSGPITALTDILDLMKSFEAYNTRIKNEIMPLPQYPNEVYDWKNIVIADDPSDVPTPHFIWTLTKKTAHPKAVKMMEEDWLWSPADDFSPFGNDDGHDAFYAFKEWREENNKTEPALFLDALEKQWQMSFAHKNVVDDQELEKVEQKNRFYRNIDRSIIAIALGQIVLEGEISPKLKDYGIKAVTRTKSLFGAKDMMKAENEIEYKSRLDKILFIFSQF